MNLKVFGTGSSGNCYALQDNTGNTLLLDAGIRFSEICKGLDFDISKVFGALCTHEHGDHSKAVRELLKSGIPVYMSQGTSEAIGGTGSTLPVTSDGRFDVFKVGPWYVQPFSTQHDAADPTGFLLSDFSGNKLIYATDTYYLKYNFTGLNFIIIECNYCTDILMHNIEAGNISGARKDRLLHSHFSLENVLKFLKATDLTHCLKIVLVHLSDVNSNAKQMVNAVFKQTGIETIAAEDGMDINFDLFPF